MNKEQLEKANDLSNKIRFAKEAVETISKEVVNEKKRQAMAEIDPTIKERCGSEYGTRLIVKGEYTNYQCKSPILPMLAIELAYQIGELKKLETAFSRL